MKLKLAALALSLAAAAQTNTVLLGLLWDAPDFPGITNYTVYGSTNVAFTVNLQGSAIKQNTGTNTAATLALVPVVPWYFTVTATSQGMESPPSNVLKIQSTPPPLNFRRWFIGQ